MGLRVAIGPNAGMRRIGEELTRGRDVTWVAGTGEETTLPDGSVDLFAMGSSFNTTDREATLVEAARVLRPGGWFACMWNHRDLSAPSEQRTEAVLREFFPDYRHGVRREDQGAFLARFESFEGLAYIEETQQVVQPIDDYIAAWKSVRNTYWDLAKEEGQALFARIESRLRAEHTTSLDLRYTTRLWMVRKRRGA